MTAQSEKTESGKIFPLRKNMTLYPFTPLVLCLDDIGVGV